MPPGSTEYNAFMGSLMSYDTSQVPNNSETTAANLRKIMDGEKLTKKEIEHLKLLFLDYSTMNRTTFTYMFRRRIDVALDGLTRGNHGIFAGIRYEYIGQRDSSEKHEYRFSWDGAATDTVDPALQRALSDEPNE